MYRFWLKLSFYLPNFIRNFNCWPKFKFGTKMSSFYKKFKCWQKFKILGKISNFGKNFKCWQKFHILTQASNSDKNFKFRPNFHLLNKLYILKTCKGSKNVSRKFRQRYKTVTLKVLKIRKLFLPSFLKVRKKTQIATNRKIEI